MENSPEPTDAEVDWAPSSEVVVVVVALVTEDPGALGDEVEVVDEVGSTALLVQMAALPLLLLLADDTVVLATML